MSTSAFKRYTVDEYLAFERASDIKHEFYDGEIFAMAGATEGHNLIVGNLVRRLGNALDGRPCRVYPSDMKVLCPSGLRAYPDVTVVCDEPRFESDRREVLLNPLVIIEVLSESTELYDRRDKFRNYWEIDSLAAYVLVSHTGHRVEHYARGPQARQWVLTTADGTQSTIALPALGCSVPLQEIYAKVEFELVERSNVREAPL
ncbi:MAG: Uma2 family endonuclease [Planctomycetaceae bacterium]